MEPLEPSFLLLLGAGLAVGLRHAFEPDHLAAVSAFAARSRGPWGAARCAAEWGLGHALVLVVATGFFAAAVGSFGGSGIGELPVAASLIYLGRGALRRRGARVEGEAAHPHSHRTFSLGPLSVGGLHGLAGSAAFVLGAAGGLSRGRGMTYALVVGLAALAGMVVSATILHTSTRHRIVEARIVLLADVACLAVGLKLLYSLVLA